jgi:hypothetical protein
MNKFVAMCLLVFFIGCGSLSYAADSECDCNCQKGGLGLKIGHFIVGFGVKNFSSAPGCNKNFGIMFLLGSESGGLGLGLGYDQGVIGFGLGFKGSEKMTTFGFGLGYDYGDCRMVWPYEE